MRADEDQAEPLGPLAVPHPVEGPEANADLEDVQTRLAACEFELRRLQTLVARLEARLPTLRPLTADDVDGMAFHWSG